MDVSSSSSTTAGVDAMKKAMDAQTQQITTMLEKNQEQMQQIQQQNQQSIAQKTGIGSNLNILG
jgi:hypothetical protein